MKIFYAIIFLIAVSCKKDSIENPNAITNNLTLPINKGLEASYNLLSRWNPNTVFFAEYNTYSFAEDKVNLFQTYDMWASFDNDDKEQNVSSFLLNGIEVPKDTNGGFGYGPLKEKNEILSPYFGSRITTKIIDAENIYAQELTYDLPKSLLFTNDFHKDIIFPKAISPALKRGTAIDFLWDHDSNSKMGIQVICKWDGRIYKDFQWVDLGRSVENIEFIRDEGNYTFSERMLEDIPDNATHIVLTFYRRDGGIYKTKGGKDIRHSLFSSTTIMFALVD